MKTIAFKQVSLLLGAATVMLGFNSLKAQAQTVASDPKPALITSPSYLEQTPVTLPDSDFGTIPAPVDSQLADTTPKPLPGTTQTSASALNTETSNPVSPTLAQAQGNTPPATSPGNTRPDIIAPGTPTTPGTTTTPGTFTPATPTDTTPPRTFTPGTTTPGTRAVTPGRATNSGSSYIGVGGNIGLGDGDTALGEGSFAVMSKIGLTRNFSVRPAALFGDSVTVLLPVTYDFSFGEGPTGELGFTAAPYVGIGTALSTGDDFSADLLLTGGIDVPLGTQLTATASVNASVTGNAAVGLLLGVGYNFAGF